MFKRIATETSTKNLENQVLGGQPELVVEIPLMKSRDESREEVSVRNPSVVSPKHILRVGAWNVRTMYETGKAAQVMKEMRKYKLRILGLSETRWTGNGKVQMNTGETLCYSGRNDDRHQEGVGIVMCKQTSKSLIEWEPINSRIIRARFYSKFAKLTIIQCYGPTEGAEDEDKDLFYDCLQQQVDKTPRHDILLLIGDLNAKVGQDNSGYTSCMGSQGVGICNENGNRLKDLGRENGLVVGGTLFKHKEIHVWTWNSPDGHTRNQIDHVLINQKWRRSLLDVKVVRGADVGSDHHLVLAKLRLKLLKTARKACHSLFDSQRLRDPLIKDQFTLELKNYYSVLENIPDEENIDTQFVKIKEAYTNASTKTLGFRIKQRKEWLSEETWQLINQRKIKKHQMLAFERTYPEQFNAASQEYKALDRQVKKSARNDKRQYINNLGKEAQEAADRRDTRTVYKISKAITGNFSNMTNVIKDKEGRTLAKEEDQLKRWAEHFSEVLNRDAPDQTFEFNEEEYQQPIEMNRGKITLHEILTAIKQTKGNRAPGEDRITADMLKADPLLSAKILQRTFNEVWEKEITPLDWKRGIIVKLPKKGDLTSCGNWRGINLLSVPGKIFCRILLQRIRQGVDRKLREEQAGFRAGRSCTDQIFILRNIVEQSIEWNSSLYINFIDFEKAFDSIHHPTLWQILKIYGLPSKVINIIQDMYSDNQCCVRHEGTHSEWFKVKTGVRQGCIISPLLFLIVIDYIMRKATSDRPRGIVWKLFKRVEDCDFADDIALLSHTHNDIQVKTERVANMARKVGLRIHAGKTKVLKVKARSNVNVMVEGSPIEYVSKFKYLGSNITDDGCINEEVSTRIGLAAQAFRKLKNIWNSTSLSTNIKLRIYRSNVRSILLYASETWRTNKSIESRLRGFEGRCLRRILRISWRDRVTNEEIWKRTGIGNIVLTVKRRRWTWFGHVLRMKKDRHPLEALSWAPPGKRSRGRPLGTWRRTIKEELREMGKTWNEVCWMAQDRAGWRSFVDALCSPDGTQED